MIQPATLCYIHHEGKTLMLHRVKKNGDVHHGKWNGLGGKFQPGETPEACVVREVKEESGLLVRQPILRGILTFPNFTPQTDWLVFLFTARHFEGSLIESREGNLKWIPDTELFDLNLWEGDKHFLEWLKKPGFFSGHFLYENKSLKDFGVTFYDALHKNH